MKPDLAGRTIGYWQVQDDYITIDGQRKWKCTCKCGAQKMVLESNLLRGRSRSCGCYSRELAKSRIRDLSGQTFGRLTVLEQAQNNEAGRVCWRCICTCGKECVVTAHGLKTGKSKSCGCLKRESKNAVDLSGQTFGRLSVLFDTGKRSYKGTIIWRCQCMCGRELDVTSDQLLSGHRVSCGCQKREWQQQIYQTLHRVDHTCVEYLEKRKSRADNTSGYQGVYKISESRYRSSIGFNGRRYHLGYFDSLEEAVAARQVEEVRLHDTFLNNYYRWRQQADQDPQWAEAHPLCIERA